MWSISFESEGRGGFESLQALGSKTGAPSSVQNREIEYGGIEILPKLKTKNPLINLKIGDILLLNRN